MRRIVYGSGAVITTDDVASALVRLSASVANMRSTDVISIPIVLGANDESGTVELIIGSGIPILTEPASWHGDEPDFSTSTTLLHMHRDYPYNRRDTAAPADTSYAEATPWDPDLDGY